MIRCGVCVCVWFGFKPSMHHSSEPFQFVSPGCVHGNTFLFPSNINQFGCMSSHQNALCDLQGLPHTFGQFCVPRPLYRSVASVFAAGASQSCWLQILPYMVIHCSLPDSLPRPFPPCAAIGCLMPCRNSCQFWDRLKYEERPGWEKWVVVSHLLSLSFTVSECQM